MNEEGAQLEESIAPAPTEAVDEFEPEPQERLEGDSAIDRVQAMSLTSSRSFSSARSSSGEGVEVARAVLVVVRELVPEERTDVGAALPKPLKQLWEQSTVGRQAG